MPDWLSWANGVDNGAAHALYAVAQIGRCGRDLTERWPGAGTKLTHFFRSFNRGVGARLAYLVGVAALIASCASPQPKVGLPGGGSKEYFSEKEYGVKASPRVSVRHGGLRRGGGRDQIGKPYKVKGQWYYPKAVKSYSKIGKASWYGAAFHGRLTANGEIYDMTHLTAAHPTLPLPSYARVTNMANGSSVVVRINDRGPFARGRIIDLSKRAAELLDYTHSGVAKVKVDYLGRAPLHGQDDSYLMASYRPGKGVDPSDGLPSGVMIALDSTTPAPNRRRPPSIIRSGGALPESGPILPDRPGAVVASIERRMQPLAYKANASSDAALALDRFADGGLGEDAIVRSWKRQFSVSGHNGVTLMVGSFSSVEKAKSVASILSRYGRTEIETFDIGDETVATVTAYPVSGASTDLLLRKAWGAGASDAMLVRD